MTQARRPPGTPVGGQFAPMHRPYASGIELVDDDLVVEAVRAPADQSNRTTSRRRTLTADPALARLDDAGRRLAKHLGYDYADIDAVDEHHGCTTEPSTLGFVTYDEGGHFFPVGTSAIGRGVLPFGPKVFTPDELEAEIAKVIPPDETSGRGRTLTADPKIARLDEAGRRLAEHLGYDYADIDTAHDHPERANERSTLGIIAASGGSFIIGATGPDGRAFMPFSTTIFTADELEAAIAERVRPQVPTPKPAVPPPVTPKRYSHASAVREGQRSPWGTIDYVSHWDVGITNVGTAGHGGVKLSPGRNRDVHPAWRRPGGWYEEDCEWAIVAVTFPECYTPEHVATARTTARNWFPDEYEVVTGEQVLPGDSLVRDEQLFTAEHASDLVTTAALAADPGTVERFLRDDGDTEMRFVQAEQAMVKVWARVGGRHASDDQTEDGPATRAFLVPKSDYATRGRFGFVVDPGKYEEVAP